MSFLPLEANPDVMNKLLHLLGVPKKWNIVDVYGLDDDALAYLPRPVLALILLCNEQLYEHVEENNLKLKERQNIAPNLFFMKQCVPNTCGTVALIHSVANKVEKLGLEDGPFKELLESAKDMTPEERGELLFKSQNEAFNLITAHQELAMEGQTEVNPNEHVSHHFMALVEKDGHLYELNGSKEIPINHGETSEDNFLNDAVKICKDFISRAPEDINFTVLALTASDN